VLLEHTETIAGVVVLYSVYGKGIPEPMRADIMLFTSFGVCQSEESCFYGTLFYDLPGSMSVNAEE
jgi:hypothetical protein